MAETGEGAGVGYTVNMPLPAGVGDDGFARLLAEVVTPVARRFGPELILVSAGYDAHWRDPLAGLHLSLGGYWGLSRGLIDLAQLVFSGLLRVAPDGQLQPDLADLPQVSDDGRTWQKPKVLEDNPDDPVRMTSLMAELGRASRMPAATARARSTFCGSSSHSLAR